MNLRDRVFGFRITGRQTPLDNEFHNPTVEDGSGIERLNRRVFSAQPLNEASSRDVEVRITPYRTQHGAQVDLIAEVRVQLFAVGVKASRLVAASDLRGLRGFREYLGKRHCSWILHQGAVKKQIGSTEIRPWQEGIREIF